MEDFWGIEAEKQEKAALQSLQGLLAIPSLLSEASVNAPFGEAIAAALHYTLEQGKALGFSCFDLDGYVGVIELSGKEGAAETIGVLCHLDVVKPDGEWVSPPFEPVIRDNKIFARGAVDDKGPLIAALFALKAVKDCGLPLTKSVRLICGTDEETGFRCVEYYKKHQPLPLCGFSPDGDFPVVFAEKGLVHFKLFLPLGDATDLIDIEGGEAGNIIPASCVAKISFSQEIQAALSSLNKSCAWYNEGEKLVISTVGRAAHASTPWLGENAVAKMLEILSALPLNEDLKNVLQSVYNLFGKCYNGNDSGLAYEDKESGAMTLSPNMVSIRENSVELLFDMRYAVTDDFIRIERFLQKLASKNGFRYELINHKKPLVVSKDSTLVQTLTRVYREATGDLSLPLAIGGGTYSRAFNNFVAFGPIFPGEKELAHMANEYLDLDEFGKLIRIYAQAIYELAK